MRLGIVGHGKWGLTWARTLEKIGVSYLFLRKDAQFAAVRGVIVATPNDTHYSIARTWLERGLPVLVEKPCAMKASEAQALLALGGICFVDHTRLYDSTWPAFRDSLDKAGPFSARAGGTNGNPWWDWGPHLVALCIDAGFDPEEAVFEVTREPQPLVVSAAGGKLWMDSHGEPCPLENLAREFIAAIENGSPDVRGLELGLKVVTYLEAHEFRGLYVA